MAGSLRAADAFLEALSTWYLRRSRRRFWKSTADEDKKFAYRTLFHVLVTFSEMLAPVVPFLAEEIYRNLTATLRGGAGGEAAVWPESVHLRPYPDVRRELVDEALNARMEQVLSSVGLGRAAREKVQIKIRQPLGRMWILALDGTAPDLDDDLLAQVGQELNIKQVLVGGDTDALVTRELKLNFAVLGTKLGAEMKVVSAAAKDGAWVLRDEGTAEIAGHTLEPGEFDLRYVGRAGLTAAGDRNLLVVIDTAISEELLREGYAREMIRAVQDLRKQAGYNVEDRITVLYDTVDERVRAVISTFGNYIAEETLARELCAGCQGADQAAELEIEKGCGVRLGVKR